MLENKSEPLNGSVMKMKVSDGVSSGKDGSDFVVIVLLADLLRGKIGLLLEVDQAWQV